MANKARYVVTLYGRNHCISGVYGLFADVEAAKAFGSVSGAARYRVSVIQNPTKFLFDLSEESLKGKKEKNS